MLTSGRGASKSIDGLPDDVNISGQSSLVSIVIPCFRQAQFVTTAIDSALSQSHPPVEVILVNDGSDDDTDLVAARYGTRVKYVEKSNGGLASARNEGIRNACGKYLLFLDADDAVHTNAVSWLLEAMADRDDQLAVMGVSQFSDDLPAESGFAPSAPLKASLFPTLIHHCFGPPHSMLVPSRAVAAVGGFDESPLFHGCEDWDLWCRLAVRGLGLTRIDAKGAFYRRYPGSMSTNIGRMLSARVNVLLRLHDSVVADPTLLNDFGQELLNAEHRVLRRLRIILPNSNLNSKMRAAIEQLLAAGIQLKVSRLRKSIESVAGYRLTEWVAFDVFKLFDRTAAQDPEAAIPDA